MIRPEHDTIRGLITYLNYRKNTGHSAARVDPDQEESWARQLELLLHQIAQTEDAILKALLVLKKVDNDR